MTGTGSKPLGDICMNPRDIYMDPGGIHMNLSYHMILHAFDEHMVTPCASSYLSIACCSVSTVSTPKMTGIVVCSWICTQAAPIVEVGQ